LVSESSLLGPVWIWRGIVRLSHQVVGRIVRCRDGFGSWCRRRAREPKRGERLVTLAPKQSCAGEANPIRVNLDEQFPRPGLIVVER
jgi:hypothetical protein